MCKHTFRIKIKNEYPFVTRQIRAGACERAGDITRVDATWHMDAARRGTHTGDPHRGPTQRGPTQGTHTEGTRTGDPHRGPTQRRGPHRGPTTGGEGDGHTGHPHRTHTAHRQDTGYPWVNTLLLCTVTDVVYGYKRDRIRVCVGRTVREIHTYTDRQMQLSR